MEYEPVIGLEVHAQLNTNTKLFSRAPYNYGQEPNTLTNPVVMALPGTLPVLNKDAVNKAIRAGLILNCAIAENCKFDRKNYFYPDLPKGYQISQFDQPICIGGAVEIEMDGPSRNVMGPHRKVQLTRIHLEEDAGKLSHCDGHSLVDLNRAGTPLIEIVSEPDIFSADEAHAFLQSIRMHLLYAGVSDCDMEKGQMRCDANISIRPVGSKTLGNRVELKNLNSMSGVRNGILYEIKRQTQVLNEGGTITQETRKWNYEKNISTSMRGKEKAHDYRYFPDPDLMPVHITTEHREAIEATIPEAPFTKQERFFKDYDLPYTLTSVFYPDRELSDFFEATVKIHNNPKLIANLIANDLLRELSATEGERPTPITECKITPNHLAELVKLVDDSAISKQAAQDVLVHMYQSGDSPTRIVEEKGLKQESNTEELEAMCQEVINNNPKPVEQFKAGKDTAINALKGQVMKASRGKANPQGVDEVLRQLLS